MVFSLYICLKQAAENALLAGKLYFKKSGAVLSISQYQSVDGLAGLQVMKDRYSASRRQHYLGICYLKSHTLPLKKFSFFFLVRMNFFEDQLLGKWN